MFSELCFSLILVLGIFYLAQYLKNLMRYYSLLFKIPGPKWTPFLGQLPDIFCSEVDFFKQIRQWSKEYGPVYILSAFYFTVINLSGPDEFELVSSSMKHLSKGKIYFFMQNWLGSGLLTSTGPLWQTRRKILTPAFHFSILQDFVNIFNKETEKLVQILKKREGESVNVISLISQHTLEIIVETAMGSKMNLQRESDNTYVSAIHKLGKIFYYRLLRPWTFNKYYFYNFHPKGRLENKLIQIINNFTNTVIRSREKDFQKLVELTETSEENYDYSLRKKLAMLDLLLNAKLTNGSIDDEGIKDEVNTIMFEGHDTTSMAICFILMLLAYHKNVQELVYEEIKQNFQANHKNFTLKELNDLKYMECVIKECLRLYPSVPFIARTLDEDVHTKDGFIFPKDSNVYIHIFDLHRNPKYWPEPEKFDPDRFLTENCIKRHPFVYVPFSAGPRNCIGQKFAMLEIKVALSGILRNFRLEPIDTPDSVRLVPDIVLRPENGKLFVKFMKRI